MGVSSFGSGTQSGSSRNQGNGTHGESKLRRAGAHPAPFRALAERGHSCLSSALTRHWGWASPGEGRHLEQAASFSRGPQVLRRECSAGGRFRPEPDGPPSHPHGVSALVEHVPLSTDF